MPPAFYMVLVDTLGREEYHKAAIAKCTDIWHVMNMEMVANAVMLFRTDLY